MCTLFFIGHANGNGWRATVLENHDVLLPRGKRGRYIDGNVYDDAGNFLFGVLAD